VYNKTIVVTTGNIYPICHIPASEDRCRQEKKVIMYSYTKVKEGVTLVCQ
jgi:hypothetical protein